jgi:hypothetical protein
MPARREVHGAVALTARRGVSCSVWREIPSSRPSSARLTSGHRQRCDAQLEHLSVRASFGGALTQARVVVSMCDATEDQPEHARTVTGPRGVLKLDRPLKQRAVPAP